jgi:imidazole glycerol-phosphate synthase subunit HisH
VIALIDYGAGNLTSVKKALAAIEADVFVPAAPDDLARATGVIVPGVGHFGATAVLDSRWRAAILERLGHGRPLLGICLGMQWLFEGSDEARDCPGLGLVPGTCYKLRGTTGVESPNGVAAPMPLASIKVPHVGWNALTICRSDSIVSGIDIGAQVYFTHSYVAPRGGDTVAVTEHGETFAAVMQQGQVAGLQFHPEKSGEVGLRFLRNFLERAR